MKKFLVFMLCLALAFSFLGCEMRGYDSEEVKKAGKLLVGVTEFEPMNYKVDGEWTGFETEFAKLFAKEKLGVEVEFVEIVWSERFQLLEDCKIDCIWNGASLTEAVKERADFSKSYIKNAQVIVAKADKIDDYVDGYAIKDLTVVVEEGSTAQECLERSGQKNVSFVESQMKALDCVELGEKDIAVVDLTLANAVLGKVKKYENLKKGFDISKETCAVGFRKGSDLTEMLNDYISEIWDEELLELANKYDLTLI